MKTMKIMGLVALGMLNVACVVDQGPGDVPDCDESGSADGDAADPLAAEDEPCSGDGNETEGISNHVAEAPSCGVAQESTCPSFAVDADGVVTDLEALACTLEMLEARRPGVAVIRADGHEGRWAWDWELHVADGEVEVIRRGWLATEDHQLYDVARWQECSVADAQVIPGCLADVDTVHYGDPLPCAVPTTWLSECVTIDEVVCSEPR